MSKELDALLSKIETIYSFNDFTKLEISKPSIKRHYNGSAIGFKYFHSFEGCVHMGISENNTFHKSDYFTQIKRIANQIRKQQSGNKSDFKVLELGCGNGFNISYLAKEFPTIKFVGIDITPNHLKAANEKVKLLENVQILNMDFDALDFKSNEFDIIYAIESVCYSFLPKKLINDCYQFLKNDGTFLLFDLFRNGTNKPTTIQEKKLVDYIEISASNYELLDDESWSNLAQSAGFRIIKKKNISKTIIPTLNRFYQLAKVYYFNPTITKLMNSFLPKPLAHNSIASYLLKHSIENEYHVYSEVILRK